MTQFRKYTQPTVGVGHIDKNDTRPKVAVRFDIKTFSNIREIAEEAGVSFAEQVRRFVARGLEAE